MTRYAPGYRKVFLEHNGPGPWNCAYDDCNDLIYVFGKRSNEGAIHHKDEDKHNNDPENLEIMHFGCHRRHHMIGYVASDQTRVKLSVASMGHTVSAETRKKIGDANRGNKYSVGRKASPETREKLRNMGKPKTCECGLVTSAASMVSHIRSKGHNVINEIT